MKIYTGWAKHVAAAIAAAMSLYHMYTTAFGPPEAAIFRGTHLLFALVLVFLLFPRRAGHDEERVVWSDVALSAA